MNTVTPDNGTADRDLAAYRSLIAEVYELAGRSRRSSDHLAQQVGQTASRWHLMSVLTDEPLSVSDAARRLGLARQSVQRVANDLLREGLASSVPDPSDARAPRLRLTRRGQRTTEILFQRSEAVRAGQLAQAELTGRDLAAAREVLRRLCEVIDT